MLVLEILAGRLLAPYVGVSLETFTGIIGTILAGIALGSAIGGRLADRVSPTKLIGPSLALGGLLTWASLPIIGVLGPGVGRSSAAILILSLLAFFAPATVLSAINPMVTKLRIVDLSETGTVVGSLSAASTAGALVGTFLTGFILVAAIATKPIILGLGAVLIAAGAILSVTLARRNLVNPASAAASFLVGGLSLIAPYPCEFESAYACGRVTTDSENPSLRYLILDTLRHGAVDLDDPTNLEFRYTRLIGDAIDAAPDGPLEALHIGGGGFSIPRYIEATRPGSNSLVLEIDPVLVEVAEASLDLKVGPNLKVQTGDARLATAALASDSVDLIVGDAFGGLAVPWHLTTSEFVAELDRLLRPGGVYVMNVIDGRDSRFARAELATLAKHFNYLGIVVPSDGIGQDPVNQILLASDEPLPKMAIDPADGRLLGDVEAFVGDAQTLRDDFAPVEQLALNP